MMSIAFGLSVIVGLLWRRGPRTASRPRPRRFCPCRRGPRTASRPRPRRFCPCRRGPRTASRPRPRRLMRRGHPGCRPPAPDPPLTELTRGRLGGGRPPQPAAPPECEGGGGGGGGPPPPPPPTAARPRLIVRSPNSAGGV